jgi:hypothetical protein
MLPHLAEEDISTWRSFNTGPGAFSAGMLDLVAYSADGLQAKNGFVLDSAELDSGRLAQLGLQKSDSEASDHLMLVCDFQLR